MIVMFSDKCNDLYMYKVRDDGYPLGSQINVDITQSLYSGTQRQAKETGSGKETL